MKEFVIASDTSVLDPWEQQLLNLKLRLKILNNAVAKTESEIKLVEELIEANK